MSTLNVSDRLVLGIGNELRGDDAIGIHIVRTLENEQPEMAEYITEQHDLSRVIDKWTEKDVIIVDALFSEPLETGRIHCSSSMEDWNPVSKKPFSSHGLALNDIYSLGKSLISYPDRFLL